MPENNSTNNGAGTTVNLENNQNVNNDEPEPITFDKWITEQPDQIKTAFDEHITGLKNTVKATREERDSLKIQLKELLPKAEKGSELEKSLNDMLEKHELSEKRVQFVEESIRPEIGCNNPKAAWLVAREYDLFDKRGVPDWDAIKKEAPELFKSKIPDANAGSGTNQNIQKSSMNDFIRNSRR